ncbi:hypothetical protein K7X08_033350 [Anisodus acutangulus]|uniref:Uncharacterized protein n=1 Tax=Anisodus acutangulus TaxID=402998 RepID=A0A9Q1M1V6_9SOLA|nr:hypothetical protein K7X08_033350 [Anisodus acutangulus]
MEADKGKGKMINIDNIDEILGEGYEGLEDVHIDMSLLEDDDNQCDNTSNEVIHGNATNARELSSSSNRRNFKRRASPFVLKIYEMLADTKKVCWDKFEFRHGRFQRGKGQWLKNIKRNTSRKARMNEKPTEQGIDETVAFTMKKEIEEIREEHVRMREEIIMLQRQLDILEKEMEDINQAGNNMSTKKAKICMHLFNSLFECTQGLGSSEVAQEQSGEIEDGVENRGRGDQGGKRKMQIEEELGGKNEGSKKIAGVADLKSDSYLENMLMDEMNLNNLAQEQPDNFLESEELAGGSPFWTDYVEKMDHKAIFSGVGPTVSQSQETTL